MADLIQRGFNLLEMPASTTLKAKVRKEMIPRDMKLAPNLTSLMLFFTLANASKKDLMSDST